MRRHTHPHRQCGRGNAAGEGIQPYYPFRFMPPRASARRGMNRPCYLISQPVLRLSSFKIVNKSSSNYYIFEGDINKGTVQ